MSVFYFLVRSMTQVRPSAIMTGGRPLLVFGWLIDGEYNRWNISVDKDGVVWLIYICY